MCDETQQRMTLAMELLEKRLAQLCEPHLPQDQTLQISATVPYIIDYRGFKYIYLYSANSLTLSVEDLGSVTVPANTWTLLNFSPGIRILATGQTTNVPIFIRCTDERLVSPTSGSSISSSNISQWGGAATSLGQKTSANSVPVVVASDQSTINTNNAQWGGAATSLGQKTSANSVPVVLASDQSAVSSNISQWGGSAVGLANPIMTEDQIRGYVANGQGFNATTTKLTAAGAITGGLSVFNPNASGKTLIILAIRFMIGNNSFDQLNFTTSDPALGTPVTPVNIRAGSGTASIATCSSANTNVAPAGTQFATAGAASNSLTQLLAPGSYLYVPANNGIAFYSNLSGSNSWFVDMTWLEV